MGNQIHLGYAVSHLNLPNPHAQLEVFSTHIPDEWHLEEMEALGFEPRHRINDLLVFKTSPLNLLGKRPWRSRKALPLRTDYSI